MLDLSPLTTGITLTLAGLAIFLLPYLLLRLIPKVQSLVKPPPSVPANPNIPQHEEAILLVQSGGRITYVNERARELFGLADEAPNLESMARRARPSEAFLALCAGEGQTGFSLNGRTVMGTSYFATSHSKNSPNNEDLMLVSIRRQQIIVASPETDLEPGKTGVYAPSAATATNQAYKVISEVTQAISASLDMDALLETILVSVERLTPADYLRIAIWDPEQRILTPYRLVGSAEQGRRLEVDKDGDRTTGSLSGHLVNERQSLLITDLHTNHEEVSEIDPDHFPFQSYLGVPLQHNDDLVGTLEMAARGVDGFNQNDLQVLNLLAAQAAITINNAKLYQKEQLRAVELTGLANLAQTVSSIQDTEELFTQLTESIAPLINAKILGFLVYNADRRELKGQIPFIGLGANAVEMYRTEIEPQSHGDQVLQSAEVIATTDAPEDPNLQALGLHHLAMAAGIRQTVLVPLNSGGRIWGYLQAANRIDGSDFDQGDIRLLSIIAGQAASIIENADLVQVSRMRAQRAETLRRIASLTSSAATLEEILKFSIIDLARLLQADSAALFLLDEDRGELRIHRDSTFGISPDILNQIGHLPLDDPQFQLTISGGTGQFHSDDLLAETEIPQIYRPLVEKLGIRSAINVPLVAREHRVGELMVGSFTEHFFSEGDVQTVATSAGQLASAIEQDTLYSQTDQSLRTRVEQLTALTRISHELNQTLDQEHLLKRVFDEAIRTTEAECGTILVFELSEPTKGDRQADVGMDQTSPKIALLLGDETKTTRDLYPSELTVLATGESLVIDDFNEIHLEDDDESEDPTYTPDHDGVRSALIVPIAYQGQIAGLINLHSGESHHFGQEEREIGETLAIQAAIALGNSLRYREQVNRSELLNRRVETLSSLFEISQVLQKEQPLEETLEAIAYAIQSSTPFDVVLISVYDDADDTLKRTTSAGIPLATMKTLKDKPQPWRAMEELIQKEFQFGGCYFIPYEKMPIAPAELHTVTLLPEIGSDWEAYQWHPEDLLVVPLYDPKGDPLGVISVDAPRNNLRPDLPAIETLEIFANQATLVIESQQKIGALRERLSTIEDELTLAQDSASQAQSHLPVLLHKDLEQTIMIQHLSQRSRRINAGLEISAQVGHQNTKSAVLKTLGQEMLMRMGYDVVLIAEDNSGDLSLHQTFGEIPSGVNPKALIGQRNPLRECLASGETLLVSNVLDETSDWHNTPLIRALDAESFICMSIEWMEAEASEYQKQHAQVALLASSSTAQAPFTEDDAQLFHLMAHQAGIALRNIRLLDETTHRLGELDLLLDFSRQLSSLDPSRILQTLIDSALDLVPAAEGAMIAVWDNTQELLIPQAAVGYTSNEGLLNIKYQSGEGLPGQVFENPRALLLDEVNFSQHYNLSPDNLMRYRNATGGMLPVSSMAIPIASSTAPQPNGSEITTPSRSVPLGVLVLDNAHQTAAFTEDDLAVITSLAHQTALTLENARLYQASEQRSQQLQSLTEVSTMITSSLQTEELISALLEQLQEILPYDTGILWLRDEAHDRNSGGNKTEKIVIRAARGFDDDDQRVGLSVDIQDSVLLNEMIHTGQPIWVANILEDSRFYTAAVSLGDEETTPIPAAGYSRLSWLGVPLIVSGNVFGVIALEKKEPNFYRAGDIQVATTFAGQAAVGLENAQLYQESVQRARELDRRSQTLATLNRLSSKLSGSLDVNHIYHAGVRELFEIIPADYVSALRFDYLDHEETQTDSKVVLLQAEYPAQDDQDTAFPVGIQLPNTPLFERLSETLGIFNTTDIGSEYELAALSPYLVHHQTRSLLAVPIFSSYTAEGESTDEYYLHGLLLAHSRKNQRYSGEELGLARTISNQVGISLQNARLFEETRRLTEDLELRVQLRTAEVEQERTRAETLLRIITELSASLDIDQVLNSTLNVLREYVEAAQITVLIARPGETKLHRLASVGYTPKPSEGGEPTPFEVGKGLAGWVISQRQSVLVKDLLQDERWVQISYPKIGEKRVSKHRSALGVPLMSGADALGALMLFHPDVGHFSIEHLELVTAATNQVAIAVNNAELYRLIRDQAEDLGNLLRLQQIETSRSKAILEAVADGVLVTDEDRTITLFNESAEKILSLERSQVVGKSLDHFSGLFGKTAQNWTETIHAWSQDPEAYEPGNTHSERINLEDGRVISVHLAPVSMQNDFLGTVSIFQDITHQVEVDRLKSEFVGTVSHELRTPMTSIKGYVEVLLMGAGGPLTEQQTGFLEIVKTNTERLAVLVNDLLDISQIEAGKAALSLQPLNLEQAADQAITFVRQQSDEDDKPIQIVKEIQPGLPRVFADPERLRQIFENILDNAYKYNNPEGKIHIRMNQVNGEIQVDIKDTGLGIPPGDHHRVFERFYRGENPLVLGISGTGLGLSIVANLIEMHQGRIWFESTGVPGDGSTFSFTLPVYTKMKDEAIKTRNSNNKDEASPTDEV